MSIQDLSAAYKETDSAWPHDQPATRTVKVRVNAAGLRSVGLVSLPTRCDRLSDHLNDPDEFFTLFEERNNLQVDPDNYRVIAKRAVSYVEAVEEPRSDRGKKSLGVFMPVTVQLSSPLATLTAELFVPRVARPDRVLNDHHPFVSLRNVTFLTSREQYRYLAVGKAQVISVQHRDRAQSAPAVRIA